MSETQRCEPADPTRDGWHYVQRGSDHPRSVEWVHSWGWVGMGANREPTVAARAGYRYLQPVPTPAEIAALVRESRDALGFMRSVMEERGDSGVSILIRALESALAAFPAKETTDE